MLSKEELLRNLDVIKTINESEDTKERTGVISTEQREKLEKYYEFLDLVSIIRFKDFIDWDNVVRRFENDRNKLSSISEVLFSLETGVAPTSEYGRMGRRLWLIYAKEKDIDISQTVICSVLKNNDSDEILTMFSGKIHLADFNAFTIDYDRFIRTEGKNINYDALSRIENISVEYIKDHVDEFNWKYLSESHDLTEEFLFEFRKRIDLEIIEKRIEKMED